MNVFIYDLNSPLVCKSAFQCFRKKLYRLREKQN